MIIDGILLSATAPGTSGVAATVAAPGSLTLQPDADPRLAYALTCWQAPTSFVQVTSPDGHDTTRGWRAGGGTTGQLAMLRTALPRVGRGESLNVTIGGSATAGDVELVTLAVAYPSIPGGDFVDAQTARKARHITSLFGSLTPTTNGTWPAGTALSAIQDTLRANARYAVLGVEIGNAAGILCAVLQGPDTGWYRVPIPAMDQGTSRPPTLMPALAEHTGLPLIPVIQSGNRSQTYLGLVGNENATARNVNLILAML